MLKSMTGFGRGEQTVGDKTFLVEVKALNGKQFELQLKLPPLLRPYEFDIRNLLQEHLIRGTIDCYVNIKQNGWRIHRTLFDFQSDNSMIIFGNLDAQISELNCNLAVKLNQELGDWFVDYTCPLGTRKMDV